MPKIKLKELEKTVLATSGARCHKYTFVYIYEALFFGGRVI